MAEGKKSFIAYVGWGELFDELPNEQSGKLVKILFRYVRDENPEILDPTLKMAFISIKQDLKRDLKKWEQYVEKQKINGQKGGRPPKAKKTQKTQAFFKKPKKGVDVDVDVNESTNVDKNPPLDFSKNKDLMMQIVDNQSEHATWIETYYRKFRLANKKLGVALKDFNDALVSTDTAHKTMKDYKQHFFNWMNIQESKGKLEHLKK